MALVGAGAMGARYVDALRSDPHGRVVSVCDIVPDRAAAFARKHDLGEPHTDLTDLLDRERIDGLIVATPDFAHRDVVVQALDRGLNVLCEKPLATTVDDAVAMVESAAASRGRLMVNFGNRHRPAVLRAKSLLGDDGIGRPRYLYLRLNEKADKTSTLVWSDRTNALWFLVSHLADLACWFTDDVVESVFAADGTGPGTTTAAVLTFSRGAVAVLESTWDLPHSYRRDVDLRVAVHTDGGVVELDVGDQGLTVSAGQARTVAWDSLPGDNGEDWWNRSCRYFTRSMAQAQPVTPGPAEALANVLVLSGLQRCLDTGQTVRLTETWPQASARLR